MALSKEHLCFFACLQTIVCLDLDSALKRLEYKVCLRSPNISTADGRVPFWTVKGDTILNDKSIRLSSSLVQSQGLLFSNRLFQAEDWIMEARFKVAGSDFEGGEGMAFWFTKHPISQGSMFGARDVWEGLSVVIDSYSNLWTRDLQMIGAIVNDGSFQYDKAKDGAGQLLLASFHKYRNHPGYCDIRVTYLHNSLFLEFRRSDQLRFSFLGRKKNVHLPHAGYFGVSALAGSLSPDTHDLLSFDVHVIVDQSEAIKMDEEWKAKMADYHRNAIRMESDKLHSVKKSKDDEEIISDVEAQLDTAERIMKMTNAFGKDDMNLVLEKLQIMADQHKEIDSNALSSLQNLLKDSTKMSSQDKMSNLKFVFEQFTNFIHERSKRRAMDLKKMFKTSERVAKNLNVLKNKIETVAKRENARIVSIISSHDSSNPSFSPTEIPILRSRLEDLLMDCHDMEKSSREDARFVEKVLSEMKKIENDSEWQNAKRAYFLVCFLIVCAMVRFGVSRFLRRKQQYKKHY